MERSWKRILEKTNIIWIYNVIKSSTYLCQCCAVGVLQSCDAHRCTLNAGPVATVSGSAPPAMWFPFLFCYPALVISENQNKEISSTTQSCAMYALKIELPICTFFYLIWCSKLLHSLCLEKRFDQPDNSTWRNKVRLYVDYFERVVNLEGFRQLECMPVGEADIR